MTNKSLSISYINFLRYNNFDPLFKKEFVEYYNNNKNKIDNEYLYNNLLKMRKNYCPICNDILLVEDRFCKNDVHFPYYLDKSDLSEKQILHLNYHKNNYKWNDKRKNNHSNSIKKLWKSENSNYSKEYYSKRMTDFNNKNWKDENFINIFKNPETIERKIEAGKNNWKNGEYRKKKENFIKNKENKLKNILLQKRNFEFCNSDIIYNFDNLKNVPGVWALWGFHKETDKKECLTVGQSINIGQELKWSLRILANEKLQKIEEENPGSTGRWDKIQKFYNNFYYVLVCKNEIDKNIREKIEIEYAIINNALYWKPSPIQLNLIKNI